MNKKIFEGLNEQIGKEFYSAYLYLELNNYFMDRGLDGFAHWFEIQSREECNHAMRIYRYLHNEGMKPTLLPIAQPGGRLSCYMDALNLALEHEKKVTRSIYDIYDEALASRDYRTMKFLDWFVSEQAEEETNAQTLIDKMCLYGNDDSGMYLLDQELGKRK